MEAYNALLVPVILHPRQRRTCIRWKNMIVIKDKEVRVFGAEVSTTYPNTAAFYMNTN